MTGNGCYILNYQLNMLIILIIISKLYIICLKKKYTIIYL